MRAGIARFLTDRRGATAVEYGLIVGVLSLAIVSGVGFAGDSLKNVWLRLANVVDASWQE